MLPADTIARGSRVRLSGLASRASLNGCTATVLCHVPESGRWAVRIDPPSDGEGLRIKPENLTLVPPSDPRIHLQHLLRQLEPNEYHLNPRVGRLIIESRKEHRTALITALLLKDGHNTNDPLLNDPSCQVLVRALDPLVVRPYEAAQWARVSRSWAATVRGWMASSGALPFWQRVCAGLLPSEVLLHPELCTKDMLLEWVRLPMAVGTKQDWYRCGIGMARNDEESAAMTELELAIAVAQLFILWWNVGCDGSSPRFVGWISIYFNPFLSGRVHTSEANPGVWRDHPDELPQSLLANVCDCIQDFRWCPNMGDLPELAQEQICTRTI
eukprot:2381880-Prymnesium_polylepis.1